MLSLLLSLSPRSAWQGAVHPQQSLDQCGVSEREPGGHLGARVHGGRWPLKDRRVGVGREPGPEETETIGVTAEDYRLSTNIGCNHKEFRVNVQT